MATHLVFQSVGKHFFICYQIQKEQYSGGLSKNTVWAKWQTRLLYYLYGETMSEKATLKSSLDSSQVASAVAWGERGEATVVPPLPHLTCMQCYVQKFIDDLHAGFLLLFIYGFLPLPAVVHWRPSRWFPPLIYLRFFAPLPAVVQWRPSRWFPPLIYLWFFAPYPLQCTLTTFSLVSSSYLSTVFAPYPL